MEYQYINEATIHMVQIIQTKPNILTKGNSMVNVTIWTWYSNQTINQFSNYNSNNHNTLSFSDLFTVTLIMNTSVTSNIMERGANNSCSDSASNENMITNTNVITINESDVNADRNTESPTAEKLDAVVVSFFFKENLKQQWLHTCFVTVFVSCNYSTVKCHFHLKKFYQS